jgi:transcriptional regulator with XRE-family HTH domain
VKDQGDLGEFLQARRKHVQPEAVGIEAFGRRRVSGLRREELAALAGVSVDYYVRLEQGRAVNPSEGVLDAIARVLALEETERIHLQRLGRAGSRRERAPQPLEVARPGIARLLETLDCVPAYLLGRRLDLIAWSAVGSALLGDFAARPAGERNLARLVFLDPAMQDLFPDWERVACETVGLLQLAAGRNPHDPDIAALVEELSLKRESFRSLWVDHDVAEVTSGTRRFRHPVVGDLTLRFEVMVASDDCSQTLVTYTAEADTPADTALKLLATWAASESAATARSPSPKR